MTSNLLLIWSEPDYVTYIKIMDWTTYIAHKLKTWSDNGMKQLKLLLARMGFAFVDCQQKFKYMNLENADQSLTGMNGQDLATSPKDWSAEVGFS
ncbi:hypothetical protein V6N11_045031 [Hibiscus sabdariffa]|uniref:Uncharacterized protein n=2 Tax=Hibiscus sabdariffa TaxID=183260 RepID=A0ABR2AMK3_9ROSI